jgi:hypothetical protein
MIFIPIDMGLTCTLKVCLNNGTCVYNSTTIRCTCPTGFAGARCDWSMRKKSFFFNNIEIFFSFGLFE